MARSRKKTPISGITTARSCAAFKRYRAQQERARLRAALSKACEEWLGAGSDPDALAPLSHELAPWNEHECPRDGKAYWPAQPTGRWDPAVWTRYRNAMMRK